MDDHSLAWATHITTLAHAGSTVTDLGTHLFVTTPDNPTHQWANYMLLKELPLPGGAREVMGAYDTWFRTNRHRSIGVDTISSDVDLSEFEAAGMRVHTEMAMVAEELREPALTSVDGGVRPITPDEWEKWIDLEVGILSQVPGERPATRAEVEGRARQEQALVAGGRGQRWAVFIDGRIAASAGLYDGGKGIWRFHNVSTHPRRRGQGLAALLMWKMAQRAVRERQPKAFMVVTPPGSPEQRLAARMGMMAFEPVIELRQTLPGEIA